MVIIIVNGSIRTNPNISTWTNRNSVSTSSWVTASPFQFRWGSKFTMMGQQCDVVADVLSGLESSTSWSQKKLRVHTALPARWLETRPGSHSWMGSTDRSRWSVLADPSMEIWGCTEGKCEVKGVGGGYSMSYPSFILKFKNKIYIFSSSSFSTWTTLCKCD